MQIMEGDDTSELVAFLHVLGIESWRAHVKNEMSIAHLEFEQRRLVLV